MSSFNKEVFAQLLNKAKGTRTLNEFARQADVANSYLSNLMRGKKDNAPEGKTIKKIADAAHNDVTYSDLLEAAGLLTPELQEKIERLNQLKKWNNEYEQAKDNVLQATQRVGDAILQVKEAEADYNLLVELEQKGQLEHITQFIRVPLLGHIAAGQPIFANDHIRDFEYYPKNGYAEGELFSLEVKGDSMIGARIFEGDKVLVRVQPEVEDGEIAVVNVDGENATLKRVKRINGKILLLADNPIYEPIVIDSDSARICGKVVQVVFNPNSKKF